MICEMGSKWLYNCYFVECHYCFIKSKIYTVVVVTTTTTNNNNFNNSSSSSSKMLITSTTSIKV